MRRFGGAFLLLVCFFLAPAIASAEGLKTHSLEPTIVAQDLRPEVTVQGRELIGEGWEMTVGFRPGAISGMVDALLVYAEPSHSLLFAYAASDGAMSFQYPEAATSVTGPLGAFQHTVLLPAELLTPTADKVHVVLVQEDQEHLVSVARVMLDGFGLRTSFKPSAAGVTATPGASSAELALLDLVEAGNCPYNHCCSGFRCATNCICCTGPYFCCSLIACTIECGSGDC